MVVVCMFQNRASASWMTHRSNLTFDMDSRVKGDGNCFYSTIHAFEKDQ